jgi:energy-coupling factor transport system permease protein
LTPEKKILFYLSFIFLVSAVSSLKAYALIFLLLCIAIILLRVPFRIIRSGWIPIGIFLLFTFAGNLFNQHGKILVSSPFIITQEGLNIALLRTFRILFLIAGAKILIAASGTEEIIHGLWKLLRPFERFGLPVRDFFHTMGLTLKCFPILKDQVYMNYREQIVSADVRGIRNRARAVSLFLLPLFAESIQNPERFFIEAGKNEEKS